jgi:hypothetical protein
MGRLWPQPQTTDSSLTGTVKDGLAHVSGSRRSGATMSRQQTSDGDVGVGSIAADGSSTSF